MLKTIFLALLFVSLPSYASDPTSQPSGIDLANNALQVYKLQTSKAADEYHAALESLQSKLVVELKIAQKQAFRQESLDDANEIQKMIDAIPRGSDPPPQTGTGMGIGESTVFLCQASGAMLSAFPRVREEVMASVNRLLPMQTFNIIVFHADESDLATMSKTGLLLADPDNKVAAGKFIDEQSAGGGQNPIPAIRVAFGQHPDKIVLLTNGFDNVRSREEIINEIRRLNADKKTKIDVLMFNINHNPELVKTSQIISKENDGKLRILDEGDF